MRAEDARVREELLESGELGGSYVPRMEAVHLNNAARLRELIAEHGWPDEAIAGKDGAEAAWLIVQHAIGEPEFQRRALHILRGCARVPRWHAAYLEDRIAMYEGRPQRYGTQWIDDPMDGRSRPWMLLEPGRVNELRSDVGLGPLQEIPERGPDLSSEDQRNIIANRDWWDQWLISKGWRVPFEQAVDATVLGDAAALERLLRDLPGLARARSPRPHRATLLHYLGANGVEEERQKSPNNAVEIARMLLASGAEVDAEADIYGKSTTLGLVATSVHPLRAGVQIPLLELLLEHGAAVDGIPALRSPLISALHNGRKEAAEFLARHGATLDLEGAAGVGRLDVVEQFFDPGGGLKRGATKAQMELGFMWACEYGRKNVVEFLVNKGMDLRARDNTGLTGLHWAVVGGQLEIIQFLIEKGAPLDARNVYGGTALGQAYWCAGNGGSDVDYAPVIEMLVRAAA